MKASELMIVDILRYKQDFPFASLQGKIAKVCGVDGRVDVRTVDDDKFHESEHPNWLEPIPLTYEIIEKNRMRVFEHRNPWQEEAKNLIKKWYSKDGKFYVSHYRVWDEFTYTVGNGVSRICSIKYVHELQHALRLLRIEKEIEL